MMAITATGGGNLTRGLCRSIPVVRKATLTSALRQQPSNKQTAGVKPEKGEATKSEATGAAGNTGAPGARSQQVTAETGKVEDAKYQSGQAGVNWDEEEQRWRVKWVDANTGKTVRMSFRASTHGGVEPAKEIAIAEQKGWVRMTSQQSMPRAKAKYQSNVPGVTFDGTPGKERWLARIYKCDGTTSRKSFSVRTHGIEEAQRLAEKAKLEEPGKTS